MTRKEVLSIVDSCFHMFASSYRADAEEHANKLIDKYEPKNYKKLNIEENVLDKVCVNCGKSNMVLVRGICLSCSLLKLVNDDKQTEG